MADPSIDDLRRRAAGGDPAALTRLGEALIGGSTPADLAEAAAALDRATRAGDPDSPARLAVLFAAGIGAPQNWTAALDLLRIGAERGSAAARGQLAALAGEDVALEGDVPTNPWARMRDRLDPSDWSEPCVKETLSRSPRIQLCPPFLSPALRQWIIARAEGRLRPAQVFDPATPGLRIEAARTNSAFELGLIDMDVVMVMLRFRIAATVGVNPADLEPPQILHYQVGQRFEPHYDFFDANLPGHVRDLTEKGQRIATVLVYLNTDFEGGETEFPLLGQRYKPPAGGGLCFFNTQTSGEPDRRTLHAGLAPTQGEKWIVSQWIRAPADPARTPSR